METSRTRPILSRNFGSSQLACSISRGLLSITVKPIQIGSKLNSDCHYHYRGLKDGDGTRDAPLIRSNPF
jgi:hypothetical protein